MRFISMTTYVLYVNERLLEWQSKLTMIFTDGFNPVAAKSYLEEMLQFEKRGEFPR